MAELFSETLRTEPYPAWVIFLGAVLAAGGFAMFFGGDIFDGIAAGIIGVVLTAIDYYRPSYFNQMARTVICSFAAGLLSYMLVNVGIGHNTDRVMIGSVMILVPGLTFGNALRDLLCGDVISGSIEIVNSILSASMIAFGYSAAILHELVRCDMAIQFITTVIRTVGFALVFRLAETPAFCGARRTYFLQDFHPCRTLGRGLYFANFLAAAATALFGDMCKCSALRLVFLALHDSACAGSMLYSAMSNFLAKNYAGGLAYAKDSALTGLGIASGIIAVSVLGSAGIKKFGIFGRKA